MHYVCSFCNEFKGANVAGYDPQTGKLTKLFHPRRHLWSMHFERRGVLIIGKTAIGRTTVGVLELNAPQRVRVRVASLIATDGVNTRRGNPKRQLLIF